MIGVIVTGGTIAATLDQSGSGLYAPRCGSELLAMTEQIARERGYAITVERWQDPAGNAQPLIDSCDITSKSWHDLVHHIERMFETCNAVVILHGTDTLAYTACAVAFANPRWPGPVVLTGAQIPLVAERSDAPGNLSVAIDTAAGIHGDLGGDTVIAFGGSIMRAVHTSKHSTREFHGFKSWNCSSITATRGIVATTTIEHWQAQRQTAVSNSLTGFTAGVVQLRITPGIDMAWLTQGLLAHPPGALVVELYGVGSAPYGETLGTLFNELRDREVLAVAVTACRHGSVDWDRYEATSPLRDSALISGRGITPEAAVVKLQGILAEAGGYDRSVERFSESLCGEFP